MQILFNDIPMTLDAPLSIAALLESLDRLKPGAALALNQQVLPREQWDTHHVQDGDRILLFQVIAGG